MSYSQDDFQKLLNKVKAKWEKKRWKPSRKPASKKSTYKYRKRYTRGEYVGDLPDGTPYHQWDLNKSRINKILDKIIASLPTI